MALLARSTGVATLSRRGVSAARLAPVPRFTLAQRNVAVRAESETPAGSVDGEKILKDLQEKWDKVENKPQVALYGGAAVFGLWLTATVIGAINQVPLLPKILELIGLVYSTWFTWRYLLFKSSREELLADVEDLKSKITGKPE